MSHQPLATSPFEDPSNPFQDPSITSALNSQNRVEAAEDVPLTDYNVTSFHHVSDNRDPFGSTTTLENTKHTSPQSQQSGNTQFDAREEALRQKERELADRERDLEAERQRLGRAGATIRGANNFPPCFPIIYLDILTEIPTQHQTIVLWIYRQWLLFEVTLIFNFFACLWVLFSHPASVTDAPTNMGVALTELFTHTLASFFLWYRPVYNAYMKENSLYYCKFFWYFLAGRDRVTNWSCT